MTDFLGVSFGVRDNKLCAIACSNGYGIAELKGMRTAEALAFLWSLSYVKQKAVLVSFDAAIDIELIVRDLTRDQKDKLFGITRKREEKARGTPLYEPPLPNGREITEALGYRMSMLPGKVFRLARPKKATLTIFDIESFFSVGDLRETAKHFLNEGLPAIEKNDLTLWSETVEGALLDRCFVEAGYVAQLAAKVESIIEPLNLKMRQWYGPSAIAARCLTKWHARKEAKRLHEKNSAAELLKAIDCAYIGGRVEAIQLGTIRDVRTYDLNSAYAYAVTLLSQFYKPLRFTRRFQDNADAPFSVWLVDYDLPQTVTLGVLPTRAPGGAISFRGRGRGYFWQPEVDYLRQRYPGSFGVKWGYVGPYSQVTFAPKVEKLYDYRVELKEAGDKGESIIKLALSNLYGKFAQNVGSAHFQCRAWAGWITSLIRRLLLEAVTGVEDRVICFSQDAVHVQGAQLAVPVGEGLGQWKTQAFAEGFYTAPGLYDLRDHLSVTTKQATRGANLGLDWSKIAGELSDRQCAELERSFFVGWQLAQANPVTYSTRYLSEVQESLSLIPARLRARNYKSEFDWSQECTGSTINRHFDGTLSRRYVPQDAGNGALRLKLKDRGWV